MNQDPELKAWDRDRPPVGTMYPRPNPPPPNPMSSQAIISRRIQSHEDRFYGLYVKSTRNNTITTVTDPDGAALKKFSGGICGFKGHRRSGYEAGYMCAVKAIEYLEETKEKDPKMKVALYLNGFGQGRDAMNKALISSEGERVVGNVKRITDITGMKIGGTRAKKKRRS